MADLHTTAPSKDDRDAKTTSRKPSISREVKLQATRTGDGVASPSGDVILESGTLDDGKQSDGAGNTVFILCIFAFVVTALGLGGFLWRKHRQSQQMGNPDHSDAQKNCDTETKGLGGIFRRKKDRPSPLPLSTIRNGGDPSLPPYSPFSAGAGQSPWLGGNFTLQTTLPANHSDGGQGDSDTKSIISMKSVSRARREAAERAGNPFSPFAPFSPVTAAPPADVEKGQVADGPEEYSGEEEEATCAPTKRNTSKPSSSSLHYSFSLPQPSPVRYMDPEAAQAMGIHPDVIRTAEPGISEDEIERRRLRAQRRLEERQRLDEGSIVEDRLDHSSRFSEIAQDRRV